MKFHPENRWLQLHKTQIIRYRNKQNRNQPFIHNSEPTLNCPGLKQKPEGKI